MYDALRIHANGEYPAKLIDERRPSESDTIKNYRSKIYIPVTKDVPNRIISSLAKIKRSDDWSIRFDPEVPSNIAEDETPVKYFTENFPYFTSVDNWAFSVLLRNYLLDANALMLILPVNKEVKSNEYLQPYPYIFNSPDVIEYVPNDFAILRMLPESEEINTFQKPPAKYLVVTNMSVFTYVQDSEGKYYVANEYKHNLGRLPIADSKGVYLKSCGLRPIFESQISAIVPRLDEAAREYSDLQAEVVQHIHSEKWEYASQNCTHCANENGVSQGFVNGKKGKTVCPKCHGSKTVGASPYTTKVIRTAKTNMGEQPVPNPPAGYIQKDVQIVKIQDERVEKHLFAALASKNMQFLMQTPLSISGDAKSLDKDELNNTVHAIAEDMVAMIDRVISICTDYRYMIAIPSKDARKKLLPYISVPDHFDMLSSSYLVEELSKAKQGNAGTTIIYGLEKEYIAKKFHSNPDIKNLLIAIIDLDPMPNKSEDEKMTMLSNGGVTLNDYIISCNIAAFIQQAIDEHKDFYTFDNKKQMEILDGYAEEVKEKNDTAAQVNKDLDPEPAGA